MPDDIDYSRFIRPGVAPMGWMPPPQKTPGEIYAAYGDTGAMSGETEGLSPAMRAMIRRNLGRRLSDQSMAERQQTAEQAARGGPQLTLGALSLIPGAAAATLPLAAGVAGVTSRFMGDTPSQTAGHVALNLLPYGAGRLARPAAAAAGAAGSAWGFGEQTDAEAEARKKGNQQTAKLEQSAAAAPVVNDPFDVEEAKARADFAQEYARAMKEHQNPGEKRKSVIAQESLDAKLADIGERRRKAREGAAYMAGINSDTGLTNLPPRYMDRVKNAFAAGGMDAADKERSAVRAEVTPMAQLHPDWIRNAEFGGMGLGLAIPMGMGWRSGNTVGRMTNRANQALDTAETAIADTGSASSLAEIRLKAAKGALADSMKSQGVGREVGHLLGHSALGTSLPWVGGTILPNGIDSYTLPEDVKAFDASGHPLDKTARQIAEERVLPWSGMPFLEPLARSAVNSAAVASAGHMTGRGGAAILRPLEDQMSAGRGMLDALEQRATGFKPPAGMREAAPSPAPSSMVSPTFGSQAPPFAGYGALSPRSNLTVPEGMMPAPPPATPAPAPAASPTRIPPPMWTQPQPQPPAPPAPYQPMLTSIPQPIERPPGYIEGLHGAAQRSHLVKLQEDFPASFVYPPFRKK